ncbi:MAG: calcium-binding protein [Heteroscytonema crispum UTEX LB 1556]
MFPTGGDVKNGTSGNDTLTLQGVSNRESNLFQGGNGNDIINSGKGDDILIGTSSGNPHGGDDIDTFIGGPGADWFILGDGNGNYYNDPNGYAIIQYNNSPDTIYINGDTPITFSSRAVSGIGTSAEDLLINAGGLTQGLVQDKGNLKDAFILDYQQYINTGGVNDPGGLWIV